jgi:hypothetical protein
MQQFCNLSVKNDMVIEHFIFLTDEEFAVLSQDEKAAYVERAMEALKVEPIGAVSKTD